MPNWCNGMVYLTGKKEDIINFMQFFVFDEDSEHTEEDWRDYIKKVKPNGYFARSFANISYNTMLEEIEEQNKDNLNKDYKYNILIDFAWSVWSCIFEGYPHSENKEECITLQEALKMCPINLEIYAEECGVCFEEEIKFDIKTKILEYKEIDMPIYKCKKCGCEGMQFPRDTDLDDQECYDCGASGEDVFELQQEEIEGQVDVYDVK